MPCTIIDNINFLNVRKYTNKYHFDKMNSAKLRNKILIGIIMVKVYIYKVNCCSSSSSSGDNPDGNNTTAIENTSAVSITSDITSTSALTSTSVIKSTNTSITNTFTSTSI